MLVVIAVNFCKCMERLKVYYQQEWTSLSRQAQPHKLENIKEYDICYEDNSSDAYDSEWDIPI